MLDRAERERWAVICLDLGVDTSSNAGRFASEARARELHASGLNARQVAERLNAEQVLTHVDAARSGKWWPETVRRLVARAA